MIGIVKGLEACSRLGSKLAEIMKMREKQNKKAINDKIVFRIPDGYEIDYEQSNCESIVYKKKKEFDPKTGDLVVYENTYGQNRTYMTTFKCNAIITPALFKSVYTRNKWVFTIINSASVFGNIIRPATAYETKCFTRILSKNGYEYDPIIKQVREKSWRARPYQTYWYIDNEGVKWSLEMGGNVDNIRYTSGNYFSTREAAEDVAVKFREILNKK